MWRSYQPWSLVECPVTDTAMPPVVEDVQCCYPARPSSAPPVRGASLKHRPAAADMDFIASERKHRLLTELQEALARQEISEVDVQGVLGAPTSMTRPGSAGSSCRLIDVAGDVPRTPLLAGRRGSSICSQASGPSSRLSSKLLAEHIKTYKGRDFAGDVDGGISEGSTAATTAARVPWHLGRMSEIRRDLASPSVQSRGSKPSCLSYGRSWSASSDASVAPFA
eukprot:1851606-Amphidinium_carterae.1